MSLGELFGKYMRLQRELKASRQPFGISRHVDRLTGEMALVEEAIRRVPNDDEQTADTLPGVLYLYEQAERQASPGRPRIEHQEIGTPQFRGAQAVPNGQKT